MIQDMTKGNPVKLILLFSVPLLIGNIFQQLYNLSDIVIVGRLIGLNALAAVGSTGPLFFMFMFVIVGLTSGFAVITAQRFGAKDVDGVRRSVTTSIILSFTFTALLTVVLTLGLHKIMSLMNVPAEIYKDAYNYLSIIVHGLWTMNLYNLLASVIRALGDSKSPLYFLIFASVVNIILAVVLILNFHMGVAGSALAVVISQAISAFLCIYYIKVKLPILHLRKRDWKFDKDFALEHLNVGIPMAVQFSILGFGIIIIQSVCNTFGPVVIGAFTYGIRIEQIAMMPLASFGIAMATYTAQNFGANNFARIREGVKKCSVISLGLSLVMTLVIHIWGADILRLFAGNAHPDVISIAKSYLNISTLFYLFIGQLFIFRNTLQGMGYAVIPLLASLAELFIRSFAAIYLAAKFSYFGIFYAGPIAWVSAAAIVSAGYFLSLKHMVQKKRLKLQIERRQSAA